MELYEQFDSNTMIKIIILLDGTIHTKHKWQLFTVHYMLKKKEIATLIKTETAN